MVINGGCHCNNISFELTWVPDPAEIPARACTCSFCTMHGGVWTSCPSGRLVILIRDHELVNPYTFGTGTARFHVCTRCGVAPVVTSEIEGNLYALVNVNTFNNVPPSLLRSSPVSFEQESLESRLARRKRNWIAKVEHHE